MTINLTEGELWASSVLNNSVQAAREELQRVITARNSYVELLATKYDAELDPQTGQLKPKVKEDGNLGNDKSDPPAPDS